MKTSLNFIALILCWFTIYSESIGQELKRYPFKSAIVEYSTSVEGSVMGMGVVKSVGHKSLWIDNYGVNEAELKKERSETTMMGQNSVEEKENLKIIDKDYIYDINLKEQTGTKMSMKDVAELSKAMSDAYVKNNNPSTLKEFVEKNGGKWLGQETFLGKSCDVFEFMEIKQWVYKGITLKLEGNIMGMNIKEEAISFVENGPISSEKFAVPKGVEFTEMAKGIYPYDDQLYAAPIEAGSLGITFEQFQEALAEAKISGYSQITSTEQDGGYMAIYIKDDQNMFTIQALPFSNIDIPEGEEFTTIHKNPINNHDAKLVKIIEDEDDVNSSTFLLVVSYPELHMKLFIASPQESNIPLLEEIGAKVIF